MILAMPALAGLKSYSSCDVIPMEKTTWNHNHVLPQFDTSLGILTRVEFNSTLTGEQYLIFENEDSDPYDVYFVRSWTTRVTMPDATQITSLFTNTTDFDASTYDGITDYGGTSGYNDSKTVTKSTIKVYTAPSDLAYFIGGTTRNYAARGSGSGVWFTYSGEYPGNYAFDVKTNASSKLCINFTYLETTCISGYKLNEKGQGLAGWSIFVDSTPNGQLDAGEKNTTTNATGYWRICGLLPGSHIVCEVMKSGWASLDPSICQSITIADPPLPIRNLNFTNSMVACLSGYKLDGCHPGQGLSGWTINVNDSLGNNWSKITDEKGFWRICNLTNGSYTVCEVPKSGWGQTSSPACHPVVLAGSNVSGLNFTNQ
ncbi:MAG: choice-of-anchor E domain-containing protein, partial [Methanothrix sp.]|nr:choice-of-anchor E domain-containing protein [Methanothrix sp.]